MGIPKMNPKVKIQVSALLDLLGAIPPTYEMAFDGPNWLIFDHDGVRRGHINLDTPEPRIMWEAVF
ncbi:MAG: hypothetical protein ACOZF2_11275 [Thermodesulfobacteriota bacterium]